MARSFDPSNKPQTCLWCGARLRPRLTGRPELGHGLYGDGFFCTLSCSQRFGVAAARSGFRFKPKETT